MLRIIADSTCDISKEDARKMGIQIVPISVRFGNEEFLDGVEITHEEFYTRLAECDELPKTSQPSPDTFMKVFNEAVAAGDDVLGIFISSDLSGTYQSACLAALDVEEETGKKLYMVDSRSASIGTALLIREAVKLRDAGVNAADIAAACTGMSKYIKLTAVVGSLKYLKMGGRLSGAAAFAGTMLHITPVVSIEDGKVVVIGKTRGKKAVGGGFAAAGRTQQRYELFVMDVEVQPIQDALTIKFHYDVSQRNDHRVVHFFPISSL